MRRKLDGIGGEIQKNLAKSSRIANQTYYDSNHIGGGRAETIRAVDFDLQYSAKLGGRNELVVGAGRRDYRDNFHNGLAVSLNPARQSTSIASAFVQNEIALARERLYLTLGVKVEDSSLTGNNLVGQNLLGSHKEFGDVGSPSNLVKRSIYSKITFRF